MLKILIEVAFITVVVFVAFCLGIVFRPPIPWCPFCQREIRKGTPGEHFVKCEEFISFCDSVTSAISAEKRSS